MNRQENSELQKNMIVIDGTDGSGKTEQVKVLAQHFTEAGMEVSIYDFPQYEGTFFGARVGRFLDKQYGGIDQVHPFLAATLYAGDRWQVSPEMWKDLTDGKVVICNRYMSSNLAHGGAKFKTWEEREEFVKEMEELEFGVYGIPRPGLVIFLYVPTEVADKLVEKKDHRKYLTGKDKDIHEADPDHQVQASEVYQWLTEMKDEYVEVVCVDEDGKLMSIPEIGEKVWSVVKESRGE